MKPFDFVLAARKGRNDVVGRKYQRVWRSVEGVEERLMHENVRAIILLRPIFDEVSLSNPNIFSTTCESDLIHQEKLACFNHEMHQTLLAARVAVLSTSEDSTSPPSAGHIVSRSCWLET